MQEFRRGVAPALAPKPAPLPAAQVLFAGLREVPIEGFPGAAEVIRRQRLLHQVHIRRISLGFGLAALGGFVGAGVLGILAVFPFVSLGLARLLLVELGL